LKISQTNFFSRVESVFGKLPVTLPYHRLNLSKSVSTVLLLGGGKCKSAEEISNR